MPRGAPPVFRVRVRVRVRARARARVWVRARARVRARVRVRVKVRLCMLDEGERPMLGRCHRCEGGWVGEDSWRS